MCIAKLLHISKALDKVCHTGLPFKLRSYDVEGELLYFLECYLSNRKQRVVFNGQTCNWWNKNTGVPQGSVLGPLLFLIYINELPDGITSTCKIFADDTLLFSKVIDSWNFRNALNCDLEPISSWVYQWKLQFNADPKKQANEVIFPYKSNTYIYIYIYIYISTREIQKQ